MSNSDVRTSSTKSSAATLRPRTRRLISGLDEGDEAVFDPSNARQTHITSPALISYDDRPVSPIPLAHPQRATSSSNLREDALRAGGSVGRSAWNKSRTPYPEASSSLAGMWGNSWATLQGLASDLLGSDLSAPATQDKPRVRRPLSKLESHRSISSGSNPYRWGPSVSTSRLTSNEIGAGTQEEHAAALRAQKRMDMLSGSEPSYADSLGKFKRRLSDDRASVSAPPVENEDREALVYLHPVQKDDTLAGITIRYHISANVLRKANRMWPNDQVQVRPILMLPVDACAVKGRPVPGPEEVPLPGSEKEALAVLQAEEVPPRSSAATAGNGSNTVNTRIRTNSASTNTTSSAFTSSGDTALPWQHDSWVLLPGHPKPTEIGRLPRRAMGYFPPARRKSISLSDFDTPSTSLDLARSTNPDANHPTSSPTSTPPRQRRERRPSNATNGYFPAYLTGPGGVGTLGKRVNHPGPAQDGLNKMFAKHLPDVAPPRNQHALYQPEMPLYSDELEPVGSGTGTPAYTQSSSGNLNFEHVGGAIESWVRRIATKTSGPLADRRSAARASIGAPGMGAGGIGDLIEMTDEFEIGAGEGEEEDTQRGRQGSVPSVEVGGPATTATSYHNSAARERTKEGKGKRGKAD